MWQIPDAPWVRDPERYADEYYGGCYSEEDEDEDDDAHFAPVVLAWL